MTGPDGRDLTARTTELTGLLPALAAALQRDTTPGSGHRVLSAGGVVNPDVLHAMEVLHREIPRTAQAACEATGEPWHHRPLGTHLIALPRLAQRLEAMRLPADANRIETAAGRWLRVTKLALGLRTPDIPVGWDCPWCDEPSPLIVIGSEGFLRPDQTVMWQHAAVIWCPGCGTTWPDTQWEHLGRFLASV